MSDLIERVNRAGDYIQYGTSGANLHAQACHEAAQAITALTAAIKPVEHWYQSDEEHPRPLVDILTDIVADLQEDRVKSLAYGQLKKAADKLSFAAQTSGGTSGNDESLVQAIAEYSAAALKGKS